MCFDTFVYEGVAQPLLDDTITPGEVFSAIRRIKMGKALGVDCVLTSFVRHASDARHSRVPLSI